jgi:hypothetical protein
MEEQLSSGVIHYSSPSWLANDNVETLMTSLALMSRGENTSKYFAQ